MLFSVVKDPLISANELNDDLNIIHQWAHQWKILTPEDTWSNVRPRLDYCDIFYHKPPHLNQSPLGMSLNSQMEKVEKIPLAISGAWRGSSRSKLYEELGWETLSDRRKLQIHKSFNNKTPSYLKDKLPPSCRALFNGNIRKSNRYMNSSQMQLLPGIHLLNILMISHPLIFLKNILILSFVQGPKVFLEYMIQ